MPYWCVHFLQTSETLILALQKQFSKWPVTNTPVPPSPGLPLGIRSGVSGALPTLVLHHVTPSTPAPASNMYLPRMTYRADPSYWVISGQQSGFLPSQHFTGNWQLKANDPSSGCSRPRPANRAAVLLPRVLNIEKELTVSILLDVYLFG